MKRWYAPKNGGYMVFVLDGFHSIVPQSDIKAHAWDKTECPCKPEAAIQEDTTLHIIHNSFEETEAVDASMKAIGLSD